MKAISFFLVFYFLLLLFLPALNGLSNGSSSCSSSGCCAGTGQQEEESREAPCNPFSACAYCSGFYPHKSEYALLPVIACQRIFPVTSNPVFCSFSRENLQPPEAFSCLA